MLKHRPYINRSGLGILELVIAGALVLVIALGLSSWLSGTFKASRQITDKSQCTNEVQTILTNIKANDNSLYVRNWSPSSRGQHRAGPTVDDPFCSGATEPRGKLCDQIDLVAKESSGKIDIANSEISLNIRNAPTWAANLYNSYYPSAGCKTIIFREREIQDFEKLLPNPYTLPAWVQEVSLLIEPFSQTSTSAQICSGAWSGLRVGPERKASLRITLGLKYTDGAKASQSCSSNITIGHGPDSAAPVAVLGDLIAPNNRVYAPGSNIVCACPPGGCTSDFVVSLRLGAKEPGATFACRKVLPASEADSDFMPCTEYGTVERTGGAKNSDSEYRLNLGIMIPRDSGKTFQFDWVAYDTAKNPSGVQRTGRFTIAGPSCPPARCDLDDGCGNSCPPCPTPPPVTPTPAPTGGGSPNPSATPEPTTSSTPSPFCLPSGTTCGGGAGGGDPRCGVDQTNTCQNQCCSHSWHRDNFTPKFCEATGSNTQQWQNICD